MRMDDLIEGLRDDLEWARANEWGTPIMLGDHIEKAIDILTEVKQRQAKYSEIVQLHEMLTGANIPHKFAHYSDGYRITYKMNKNNVVAIFEHGTSYGHECDLLELSGGLLTENEARHAGLVKSVGWLTADNVFQRILEHWEWIKNGSECENGCRKNQTDVGADGDH